MSHYLLTGATGLLGRYLLRDLLIRNHSVAVIVRPTKYESAAQRIDNVLAHWEQQWQRWLPRPVILAGDINQPALGLDSADRTWVRANCRSVLHSAASLAFQQEGDEPWRTNVDGLKNLLDFCEEHALRDFLHISSCYVCGLREGTIQENELDVGQQFGNIYEESKVAGEKLVRDASHLDSYTIYRPSIIVGDTETGFSTTFHGFYTPLRLLSALANYLPHEMLFSVNHMENLGLVGHEGKNFVPVQWLSDAMVALMERRESSGQTYALAAEQPVRVDHLNDVFNEAIKQFQPPKTTPDGEAQPLNLESPEIQASLNTYMESFAVYQSYWRDDPRFDMTNTLEVIPDKKPPTLNEAQLLKLCQYAIQNDFAWKPTRQFSQRATARDYFLQMQQASSHHPPNGSSTASAPTTASGHDSAETILEIVVTGPGGGCWTVAGNGKLCHCQAGRQSQASTARLNSNTFHELTSGTSRIEDTIAAGQLFFTGGPKELEIFRQAVSPPNMP